MSYTQYGLIEPFETDDGSLESISADYAFTLGVQWAMFRHQLLADQKPFRSLCLPENQERLVRMAERHNRFVEARQTGCDGWVEIWVGDPISSE